MPLLTNSLLEWTEPDGKQRVVRVDPAPDEAQVVRIDRAQALPQPRRPSEIAAALNSNVARILEVDPFGYLQKPESSISAKDRRWRDRAWALIEPIVTAPNHEAFNPEAPRAIGCLPLLTSTWKILHSSCMTPLHHTAAELKKLFGESCRTTS